MLFYRFNSQEERRDFGGSAFVEIQFCKLPFGVENKEIYVPFLVSFIIEEIKKDKPEDYEVLIDWLMKSKEYNGFYILGM